MEDLERHVSLEELVVRFVDSRHAAGPYDLEELVALVDHVTDHRTARTVGSRGRRRAGRSHTG